MRDLIPNDGVFGVRCAPATSRLLALALCFALTAAGCSTTYQVVRREQRVARIEVRTDVEGAKVYSGDRPRGPAPATIELPYTVVEKKVDSGTVKTGWVGIITGTAAAAAAAGLIYWGASSVGDPSGSAFSGVGLSMGPLLGLYSLVAIAGGVYMVLTGERPNRFDTEPAALQLGVLSPDDGRLQEVKVVPKRTPTSEPPFREVHQLRYSGVTGRWSAPRLPASLELEPVEPREAGGVDAKAAALVRARPAAGSGAAARPSDSRQTPIVAVFDVETRGARLSSALRARLSDYLTAQVAASGAFQVVPRDRLQKRLRKQKRVSYKRCYDQSCQIEIGRELAAQKSLSTMIVKLGSKCSITSVLYDLRRSTSEGGATASGGCSEDALAETLEAMVRKLAARQAR